MNREMDTSDCSEKSVPTDPSDLISSERMDEIMRSYQLVKQAALHGKNNVPDNPNFPNDHLNAPRTERTNENESVHKTFGFKYEPPSLMFKRMICSRDLTSERLIPRKDVTPLTVREIAMEEEEDEVFYEKLKQRIILDIQNKALNGPEPIVSKRSTTIKKRKSPFTNECLNLMKKCRSHLVQSSGESSSTVDNGIFSLAYTIDNDNQENLDSRRSPSNIDETAIKKTSQIPVNQIGNSSNNVLYSEVDSDFVCPTPLFVKTTDVEPET